MFFMCNYKRHIVKDTLTMNREELDSIMDLNMKRVIQDLIALARNYQSNGILSHQISVDVEFIGKKDPLTLQQRTSSDVIGVYNIQETKRTQEVSLTEDQVHELYSSSHNHPKKRKHKTKQAN